MIKRQKYHLEPDRGLLNDPNGLVFYKDMYHAVSYTHLTLPTIA